MSPLPFRSLEHTLLYDPPIEEFSVLHTNLAAGVEEKQPGVEGPSVLIVTRGRGWLECEGVREEKGEGELREGSVWFVSAGREVGLKAAAEGGMEVYRAFVEVAESS